MLAYVLYHIAGFAPVGWDEKKLLFRPVGRLLAWESAGCVPAHASVLSVQSCLHGVCAPLSHR